MLPQKMRLLFCPWRLLSNQLLTGFKDQMDAKEAKLILNIEKMNQETLEKSYKRLMAINHPDRNGSGYIASKINDAKTFLMKRME